ncbi:MAG: divalent cation tolerance protein [Pseudomonadota bacterium]|jgi:periplasmic divalent cation tolerance protein
MNPMDTLLVLCNCPDATVAETLARRVLDLRLAACVNLLAPCRSLYRWEGAIESAEEVPLLIKTSADRYPALQAALQQAHPYTVPEIIALPVSAGLPAYLHWVAAETRPQGEA